MGHIDDAVSKMHAASDELETVTVPLNAAVQTVSSVHQKLDAVSTIAFTELRQGLIQLVMHIQQADQMASELCAKFDTQAAELDRE